MGAGLLVLILLVAAGYGGALHPMGDSLAVFRAQGAAALMLAAMLCLAARMGRAGLFGLVVAGLAAGPLILAYSQTGDAGPYRLYQKNVLFRNDDLAGLEADIREAAPDVLTLQEVSTENLPLLDGLADILPHQHRCAYRPVGQVVVATRLTPVPGAAFCLLGMAGLQVKVPEGRIWLVSLHLSWPWPYRQAAELDAMIPMLAGLDAPVVMAGDFNMVAWSSALRRVEAATGSQLAGPVLGTLPSFGPLLTLPIDHVLAPRGGQVTLRPLAGSDHRGLLADFAL
ncbi:MAG: endonuclease [Tabrizicola sp.]|nr:endonuclease [Tabrizicola sp.]